MDVCFILVMNTLASLGLAWAAWGRTSGIMCAGACVPVTVVGVIRVWRRYKARERAARGETVALIGLTAVGYYGPVIVRAAYERCIFSHAFIGAIVMIVGHGLAAVVYMTHLPQRIAPRGCLDSVCTSQSLLHLLVAGVYNYGYIAHVHGQPWQSTSCEAYSQRQE